MDSMSTLSCRFSPWSSTRSPAKMHTTFLITCGFCCIKQTSGTIKWDYKLSTIALDAYYGSTAVGRFVLEVILLVFFLITVAAVSSKPLYYNPLHTHVHKPFAFKGANVSVNTLVMVACERWRCTRPSTQLRPMFVTVLHLTPTTTALA